MLIKNAVGGSFFIDPSHIRRIYPSKFSNSPAIYVDSHRGSAYHITFADANGRDEDLKLLGAAIGSGGLEGKRMLTEVTTDLKGYVRANKDLIYTVLFVLVVDHFFFAGAFRERVRGLIDGFLRRAEEKSAGAGRTIEAAKVS